MKGVALNLTRSPERHEFREWADPIRSGAGDTEGALQTSANRPPGVSDSIELRNGRQVTRRATIKELLGNQPQRKYLSIMTNVKRGHEMAASRVMGIGKPQRLAMRRGNALGAKVPTICRPLKRKHCRYAKSD